MKAFFSIILFISSILYSQENFQPDKIHSKIGNSQQCFISYLDNNYVVTKTKGQSSSKYYLNTIDEIEIEGLGNIYSETSGFSLSIDSMEVFLTARNEKYFPKVNSKMSDDVSMVIPLIPEYEDTQLFNSCRRWYFSVYYYPSITKQLSYFNLYPIYSSSFRPIQPIIFELEQNLVSMESQIGFNVVKTLFITLSLGYTSDLYKVSSTSTIYQAYDNTFINRISEDQNSLDKFLFEIGFKNYFGHFEVNNVNPFVSLGIGKQIAFADNKSILYDVGQENNYIQTNNENEFLEELNSPFFASIGFGAEYVIAESLTLGGIFKVKYNSASSTYKWKNTNNGTIIDRGEENIEDKNIRYKIGLGLTFFF
jgi:hypothetical protein